MTIPDLISKIELFWQRRSEAGKWSIILTIALILYIL